MWNLLVRDRQMKHTGSARSQHSSVRYGEFVTTPKVPADEPVWD